MKDLSVLTPPFLMCAVVIIAIVAFLRHEMGPSRRDRSGEEDSESAPEPSRADEVDSELTDEADASARAASDS